MTPAAPTVPPQDGLERPGGTRVDPEASQGRREPLSGPDVCAVCHRGDPPVCDRCRIRLRDQLAALPALHDRLRAALVPAGGGGGRVPTGKGEAPMPARLAALTLLAGGSDQARCLFVPAVRVWTTVESPPDFFDDAPPAVTWHREQLFDDRGRPVLVLVDDQAGVLPVRAWLWSWEQAWRHTFGHATGHRPPARVEAPPETRQRIAGTLLGLGPAVPSADRPDDPTEQEWRLRWPSDGWGPRSDRHHGYLSHWLTEACDRVPDVGDFAASLRTLTGAIRAALGDIEDLEYVGRCPEEVRDNATGTTGLCGASIWHDPYASVITCPRCHAETGNDRRIWLARRILDAWPIDRRRRYPRGLIDVLRDSPCPICSAVLRVQWIDATERADRERFFRPGPLSCPSGCAVTG